MGISTFGAKCRAPPFELLLGDPPFAGGQVPAAGEVVHGGLDDLDGQPEQPRHVGRFV